jgi:hypothetical protein
VETDVCAREGGGAVNVDTLEGRELDIAVALALGWKHLGAIGQTKPSSDGTPWCRSEQNDWWQSPKGHFVCGPCFGLPYEWSTDWAHGGPLIEQFGITVVYCGNHWMADIRGSALGFGKTLLTAAMRTLVDHQA